MSEERLQVLKMLAEGKIDPEEAERLLARLEDVKQEGVQRTAAQGPKEEAAMGAPAPPAPLAGKPSQGPPKYLRVLVNGANGDKVNVQVPMALVRTGIKLTTLLPSDAAEELKEKGIDLSSLSELHGDELVEALRELNVDVNTADGDTVRVFCE